MSDTTFKKDCVIAGCPNPNIQHVRLCARHWVALHPSAGSVFADKFHTYAWVRLVPYVPNNVAAKDLAEAIEWANRRIENPNTPLPESLDDLLGTEPVVAILRSVKLPTNDISDLL